MTPSAVTASGSSRLVPFHHSAFNVDIFTICNSEYLYMTNGDVASFDLWTDLSAFKGLAAKVKTTAIALHDVLGLSLTANRGALSNELREDVLGSLRQGMIVGDSLDLPQQHLLQVSSRRAD